jgi:FkbM family methyltransferase
LEDLVALSIAGQTQNLFLTKLPYPTTMKTLFKKLLIAVWYRPGSVHRILKGPMKGMRFRMSENAGFAALYSGNEHANQIAYARLVREGDTVIDGGANWGVHTLYLASLTGRSGHVHAFEPHPEVVNELRANIALNDLPQVTVHQCGLLDQESELPFAFGASTKSSHIAAADEKGEIVIVPCRRLDSMTSEMRLTSLRLLKLDVEGVESRALTGAAETIARFRPHLIIELHTPAQDLAVAELLTSWNYKISRLEGPPILHLDRSWPDENGVWGTILAEPSN